MIIEEWVTDEGYIYNTAFAFSVNIYCTYGQGWVIEVTKNGKINTMDIGSAQIAINIIAFYKRRCKIED